MSKRSFRTALIVVLGTLAILGGLIAFFLHRAFSYPDEAHAGEGRDVEVEIVSGMSFPQIASMLADRGVVERPTWFRLYAMWNGKTTEVKTGKYLIKDNQTPKQVLDVLVAGVKEITVKVTLPEGKNMLEFFEILEQAKVASSRDLLALARDKDLLSRHAIVGDSVEGYLFPDTYQFRLGEKPIVVLERLITRQQEVWNQLVAKNPRDTATLKDKLGWSDRDILTMASIVEKEAADPKERPRIAQVFINRLTMSSFKPHRLETDPTIRYGCSVPEKLSAACIAWHEPCLKAGKPRGCDRLHRAQLDDQDNVYNTYQHEGLPPGPISNPGKASIAATISPDGSDYLFFVATSKNSRNHAFARTVAEHQKNVAKYVSSDP
ncbi:MAG: aminodeoxychorismate lyase [Deltaproteobacteria bacterium]|nr:aminodeoxychorismate lyase [Deltaproteobacteria bacterium]